jgi:hypothetical protein
MTAIIVFGILTVAAILARYWLAKEIQHADNAMPRREIMNYKYRNIEGESIR